MKRSRCFRPNCSGKPVARSWVKGGDYTRWYIECDKCGLHTDSDHGSEENAWADWNNRGKDQVVSSVGYLAGLIEDSKKEIEKIVIKKLIRQLEEMAK
jgi:hypothetical protein